MFENWYTLAGSVESASTQIQDIIKTLKMYLKVHYAVSIIKLRKQENRQIWFVQYN